MKRPLVIFSILIYLGVSSVFSQNHLPYDSVTQKITYKDVIKSDSLKAGGIFDLATRWVQFHNDSSAKNQGPKLVIQRIDADSNKIVAIGKFTAQYEDYQQRVPLSVYYTLVIEAKPGRSRIKITELQHDDLNTLRIKPKPPHAFEETYFGMSDKSRTTKNAWLGFFTECDTQLRAAIDSYKKYISQPPVVKMVSDDW